MYFRGLLEPSGLQGVHVLMVLATIWLRLLMMTATPSSSAPMTQRAQSGGIAHISTSHLYYVSIFTVEREGLRPTPLGTRVALFV